MSIVFVMVTGGAWVLLFIALWFGAISAEKAFVKWKNGRYSKRPRDLF